MTPRGWRMLAIAACTLVIAALGVAALAQRPAEFPHAEHAGLFPLCEGCHEGVPEGDRSRFYPAPESCTGCHDGVQEERVAWTGPGEQEPDNVDFLHPEHPTGDVQDGPIDCTTCHTPAGAPRMAVAEEPVVSRCLDCHEHAAESHLTDAACETCHIPLAQAPFERARILGLPYPADHESGEFIRDGHGELAEADLARCATCHTRERCASCHVDAAEVAEIQSMPAAEGTAARAMPRFAAHYPIPSSHERPGFLEDHGADATTARCGRCHTREDCLACHTPPQPDVVRALPPRRDVQAPGVGLARSMPPSHEAPLFAIDHGNVAAAGAPACTTCHTRPMCVECHDAAATGAPALVAAGLASDTSRMEPGAFHAPDFMARHSAEAYGRRLECSNCHDSRAFCADCHETSGMSPAQGRGRLGPGFHDAEPLWLLRHGQAARQSLESCASCHRQNECMECHSVLGAFKVNPHGPGFDAERAHARNAAICRVCHLGDPLEGRSP